MAKKAQRSSSASKRKKRSGGVNLRAKSASVTGDVVGRDKTTNIETGGGANIAGSVTVSGEGEFIGRDKIVYEAPAPIVTSLHQLPSPPRDFTGRTAELAELMTKVEEGMTICGLQGMGGVGKTTLALKFAEQLKPRYPDAQIYLDLKGADRRPLSAAAALTHIIRAYYPTSQLPDSEDDLRGKYLSALEEQRVLILTDNAANKTQIEALLPPSSCFLLVTSRQQFALPGLFSRNLDTLPPADARDLLRKIAPRIADQAEAIAKLCDYLPLGLRLAGSMLAERRTLTPEDYRQRLQNDKARLELVDASLNLSFDMLNPKLQNAWCALTVFPDTFDVAAAAAVWALDESQAHNQLDELLNYSVVDWDETAQRAHMHDLARLFTDKRLEDIVRLDCQRRYATHYQKVSAIANDWYLQGGEKLLQGLALFDLEWTNIQTGRAWAIQYQDTDEQALNLCDVYPAQCDQILTLRQRPSEHIGWLEAALIAARKLTRKETEGAHLISLSAAHEAVGEYDKAIEYLEQRLNMEREDDSTLRTEEERSASLAGQGQAYASLGVVYKHLSDYRRAIDYSTRALDIFKKIDDPRGEVKALNMIGAGHQHLGEYSDAIDYCNQALKIANEIGDEQGQGNAQNNLGIAYQHLGETSDAVKNSEGALKIFETLGDRLGQVQAWNNLGDAYRSMNKISRAIECFEQALVVAREIGDPLGEANALYGRAICHETNQARSQAMADAQAALDKYTAIKSSEAQKVRDLLAKWRE